MNRLILLVPLMILLAGCGSAGQPTTWQDVACLAVVMFGWAAVAWSGNRR